MNTSISAKTSWRFSEFNAKSEGGSVLFSGVPRPELRDALLRVPI
jgi:hypothetical protein